MSFEEAMSELEKIVERLENSQLSLDESLVLYEKGIQLVKECSMKLAGARQKVEKLIADNNELNSEPFELNDENIQQ